MAGGDSGVECPGWFTLDLFETLHSQDLDMDMVDVNGGLLSFHNATFILKDKYYWDVHCTR